MMTEQDRISKARKKLAVLLCIFLGVAFVCIGTALYYAISFRVTSDQEAMDLSDPALITGIEEGQYVRLDTDTMPVLMVPVTEGDCRYYFVRDVSGEHTYIAFLSSETLEGLKVNTGTGKLSSILRLKGMVQPLNEQVKTLAVSNGFKVFGKEELNSGNFSEYLGDFYIKEHFASRNMTSLCSCLALAGLFFLVLAFGYVVPAMVKAGKGDFGNLDEKKMRQSLEKYLPDGETLAACVHSIGLQSEIEQVFGKCFYDGGDYLIPDENSAAVQVIKKKFAKYEVYVGITQHYLILSECEEYKHYYEFNNVPDSGQTAAPAIHTRISIKDIGTCFPLAEVQKCEIKNARLGAVNCSITMKNGSFIKIMLQKSDGLGGMPHHEEYRDAIIARLTSNKGY